MANITRIKAKDSDESERPRTSKPTVQSKASGSKKLVVKKSATETRAPEPTTKKAVSSPQTKSAKTGTKRPFALFRPFIALGCYLVDSWKELRQVRWPNRSTTWKMVAMVIVYTLIFVVFLVALDVLYEFIFSKILA